MTRESWVQSLVESYQWLKKWYLIPPCLILSIMRYVSRVKWSNPGKGVAPSRTPRCRGYWKGSLLVALDYGHQLFYFQILYSLYQSFGDYTERINYNWYHRHLHVSIVFFQFSVKRINPGKGVAPSPTPQCSS